MCLALVQPYDGITDTPPHDKFFNFPFVLRLGGTSTSNRLTVRMAARSAPLELTSRQGDQSFTDTPLETHAVTPPSTGLRSYYYPRLGTDDAIETSSPSSFC